MADVYRPAVILALYVWPLRLPQLTVGDSNESGEHFVGASGIGRRSVTVGLGIAILAAFVTLTRSAAAAGSGCEAPAIRAQQTLMADRLENWEPLDDRTVLIWAKASVRAHLIRLEKPLPGLEEAEVISLVDGDRDKLISACGRDGLAIDSDAGGWEASRIVSIELLSKKRTAELDWGVHEVTSTDSLRI